MAAQAERESLCRLAVVRLVVAAVLAAAAAGVRAPFAGSPTLLAGACALGGGALLLGGRYRRLALPARSIALLLDFAALIAALRLPAMTEHAPIWWNGDAVQIAALAALALNGAAAPLFLAALAAAGALAVAWLAAGAMPSLPYLVAGGAVLLSAVAFEPWRRPSVLDEAARRLHGAAGDLSDGEQPAHAQESSPIGESDLRVAAALVGARTIAVVVNEPLRRLRAPQGMLHLLRDGRYGVHHVSLVPERGGALGLGFAPPAHLTLGRPAQVKRLQGQAGELGRLVVLGADGRGRETLAAADPSHDALLALLTASWSLRLDNRRLAADAERRLLDVVESLVTSVEAKDPYTSGHSKRVCRYSVLIAEAMGFAGRELDEVAIGAALHDVGKLGIPEQVLSKPSKLDQSEWELMKSHPKVGARIIDSFNQSHAVLHMIFHHHERYDGAGYPSGLAGERIPVHARIVGVADALDAMTSGRVYQRNRSVTEALEEVRRNAGTQFDPLVVNALLGLPVERLQAIAPAAPVPAPTAPATSPEAPRPAPSTALVAA